MICSARIVSPLLEHRFWPGNIVRSASPKANMCQTCFELRYDSGAFSHLALQTTRKGSPCIMIAPCIPPHFRNVVMSDHWEPNPVLNDTVTLSDHLQQPSSCHQGSDSELEGDLEVQLLCHRLPQSLKSLDPHNL
jgi:hypothetical protein